MDLESKVFGRYKDGQVMEYSLRNNNDMEVKILSLGAIVRQIIYKGKNRVLGFDNIPNYLDSLSFMGALIGRVAGRISGGEVEVNNEIYQLDKNEGTTCLHGGSQGFQTKLWELVDGNIGEDRVELVLKYISKDLEGGFPGKLNVYVKYTLANDDSLTIEYFAESDKDTIISLTNHSYFNLNDSHSQGILGHELMIDADEYISLNEVNIPTGISSVEDTPFDFRKGKIIGEDMDLSHPELVNPQGFDHPFILNKKENPSIILTNNKSAIQLKIETTEPVVVLYCSNKLKEGLSLSDGNNTLRYQGVCLETQWYPDALNQDFLPNNILRKEDKYYSMTKYKFEGK